MATISDYRTVPHAVDMAPYANFYQDYIRQIAERNAGEPVLIVEAGIRNGCSSRIIRDALDPYPNWRLVMIDPVPTADAVEVCQDERCEFLDRNAEAVAQTFQNGSIDLLHLDVDCDGTHPYELSFNVLLAFWRKLKSTGEIILHDCTDHFPGITRLVDELKQSGWDATHCPPAPECPIAAPVHLKRQTADIGSLPPITAVIPVIKDKFLIGILSNIEANDHPPAEIIIIDNSNGRGNGVSKIFAAFKHLSIRHLKQDHNIGVNASWNLGLAEAKTDLVSILNDDLTLPPQFFRVIAETFRDYPRAGVVIPNTVRDKRQLRGATASPIIEPITRREGWAFTIRRSAVDPIPPTLFTFFGDDWLFDCVQRKHFWSLRVANLPVYHQIGISQDHAERERLKLPLLETEKQEWARIQESMK